MAKSTKVVDEPFYRRNRSGELFPDDPPYLQAAWREYVDLAHEDHRRMREGEAAEYRWETELALRDYFDAVALAAAQGLPRYQNLDRLSRRPTLVRP